MILLLFWTEEIVAITGSGNVGLPPPPTVVPCPDKCDCMNNGTDVRCDKPNSFVNLPDFSRNIGTEGAHKVVQL